MGPARRARDLADRLSRAEDVGEMKSLFESSVAGLRGMVFGMDLRSATQLQMGLEAATDDLDAQLSAIDEAIDSAGNSEEEVDQLVEKVALPCLWRRLRSRAQLAAEASMPSVPSAGSDRVSDDELERRLQDLMNRN